MKQIYTITGMHCDNCVKKIESAIRPLVQQIDVTLQPPRAEIINRSEFNLTEINSIIAKIGNYKFVVNEDTTQPLTQDNKSWFQTYLPLFVIVGMITLVSLASWPNRDAIMLNFMAGFFIVFGSFKLFDLRGFKSAFSTYDLLAGKSTIYGYLYPFLELVLGFAFLYRYQVNWALWASIIVMSFGSLGVIRALLQNKQIRCACLGTSLNLPMSTITLIEDLVMVIMSVMMLLK
jgi:copper chaperone CopZ/drug/metabolite transporter (DMT)-like permease